jgi:MinD superfamily P-loop ATPase
LVVLPGSTLVFPELCHGCGLCSIVCPAKAITETMREVGRIETGTGLLGVKFARGILNVGEPMASPVISSLTGAHFAVLVTEPTMTGVHDLERVLSLARHFDMKTAVVVNKGDLDPSCTEDIRSFCRQRQVGFLGSIPYEPLITEAQRQRKTVLDYAPESRASIERLVFP